MGHVCEDGCRVQEGLSDSLGVRMMGLCEVWVLGFKLWFKSSKSVNH